MAKEQFSQEDIKDIKEYRDLLKSTQAEWNAINKELAKYKNVTNKTKEDLKVKLKSLIDEHGTYKDILSELKKYESLVKKIETQQEKKVKSLEKEKDLQEDIEKISQNQLINFDELNELQRSITSEYKKQYSDAGALEKKIDSTKALVGGINTFLEKNTEIQGRQKELIEEAADQYKNMPISVADLKKQLKSGSISQKEYNKALYEMSDTFEETISKIDKNDERLKGILDTLEKMKGETKAFGTAMGKTGEAAEFLFDKTLGSAPAGIGEFANSIKEARKEFLNTGTLSDVTFLGAAYLGARTSLYAGSGVGSFDFNTMENIPGLTPPAGAREIPSENDKNKLMEMSTQLKLLDATADKYNTLASASEKFYMNNSGLTKLFAEFDFQTQVELAREEFEKTSKTAFFGNQLGSMKYATDQLQLAGISAEVIASTMSEMSSGANSAMQNLSEDVAVFSKKTGIATSEVAKLTGLFRMLDDTGGVSALKEVQRVLSGELSEGFNVADIAAELAQSSELALLYNIKNSNELVKQIQSVRQLGGDYSAIAESGKSMVLNYKDTIRKAMQLSAIIGEKVDLSIPMALFAANKPEDAFKELKESGILDKAQAKGIQATNLLNQIFPVLQLGAKNYEPGKMGEGLKSNQDFLKTLQDSLKDFEIDSAIINVKRAGLRELTQFDPGNANNLSVNQQIAKLKEGAFADAYASFVDIQKFAVREGTIIGNIPGFKPVEKILRGLTETMQSQVDFGYLPNKFPSSTEKSKGLTPFQTQGNAQQEKENLDKFKKSMQAEIDNLPKIKEMSVSSNESLKKIDLASNSQTGLLQNLQTIMATMAKLTDPTLGLKLFIDGKDVKNRIEKIQKQEKATKK